ncbi:Protein fem-1 homolog B [Eumeta japonica]|uniref:Protein fem-1 homolog B n=1 Tax=Eumeta variegata TaxID=151549 RepID=A0A4C1TJY8_EUMVA|nr:Protein fem-1 homolog B [Eumeta japonica]
MGRPGQFPCTRTTRLLLECGAVVDAVDDRHRTPLHIALISYQMVPDERAQWSESLCGVVCELLGRGAHVDATDYSGVTPLIAAIGGPAETLIRSAINPRLKCLAAAALADATAVFRPAEVPRDLHAFLAMHGVHPAK